METKIIIKSQFAAEFLPPQNLEHLSRGLKFLEEFRENTLPASNRELLDLLDRTAALIAAVTEAIRVYEFLGRMQVDRIATNDNDIVTHTGAFERELAAYRLMQDGMVAIRERIIRVLAV